eukprot:GHRQ01025416.1.p3 GENE.GHRQ01025416.1~~GHRQ01025416.1.p3  ORF type:complete len:127 (-),score=25.26 GHRQ01025416.1:13-393(-)
MSESHALRCVAGAGTLLQALLFVQHFACALWPPAATHVPYNSATAAKHTLRSRRHRAHAAMQQAADWPALAAVAPSQVITAACIRNNKNMCRAGGTSCKRKIACAAVCMIAWLPLQLQQLLRRKMH